MATSTDLRAAIEEVQGQLPAGQVEAGDAGPAYDPDVLGRLARRVGALPWWVISAATHAVLFLLVALLATAVTPPPTDEVIISTDVVKQKPPEYDPQKKRDIFKNTKDVQADTQVENPVVTHEKMDASDRFETDNAMDKGTSRGTEEGISDLPLGGAGTVGSIGVGGGGMAGVFGYRDGGGRKKAVARFGGSQATESSVEAALRWLARHQEPDGHWDRKKWEGGDFSGGDVGMTGLATLAFLGAGYTSKDGGKFGDVVRRAENWLCSTLDEATKHHPWTPVKFGEFDTNMYEQGMGTLALAEAYGMTKDERLRKYAQAAVDAVVDAQGPYEGWTYQSKHRKAGRNDTSITGWQVMALKSAKIAGLKVDGNAFQGASHWLEVAIKGSNGVCAYESAPTIDKVRPGDGSMAMCAAGMIMHQFLGTPNDNPAVRAAADQIKKYLPTWDPASMDTTFGPTPGGKNGTNYYYWYYGSLAMFQFGGEHWTKWNEAMKKILVEHQRKGGPLDGSAADVDGSYDPVGSGGIPHGGRVMATALAALTLEVYYRYLPLYSKQ